MTCDVCQELITIGDHPFCPHGRANGSIIDDTLTGGARWVHNLDDKPIWVETKTQLKQEMAKRGLVPAERSNYNRDDKSPYATRTRLRAGQHDPFVGKR